MLKSSEIIKRYRKNHNITVAQLAEKIGVSQVFLTKIENEQKKISVRVLKNLKNILSESEYKQLIDYENFIKTPLPIRYELEKLKQLEKLKGELLTEEKDMLEFQQFIKSATLFFNNEQIQDEDKKKLIDALIEIFYDAKLKK